MRTLGFILVLLTLGLWPRGAQAAVGCSLNDPDEDIQRFFPEMTSYRVHFVTLKKQNPDGTAALERGLGTPLDPVFETADVPYSLYVVEGPQTRLGYVLGSNNRGAHGSIQVIAALDAKGQLLEVYLQKIRSPEASQFRSDAFLDALAEHSLEDFSTQASCYRDGLCDAALVADPSEGRATEDYHSILRGLAKLHWLQELLLLPLGVRLPAISPPKPSGLETTEVRACLTQWPTRPHRGWPLPRITPRTHRCSSGESVALDWSGP